MADNEQKHQLTAAQLEAIEADIKTQQLTSQLLPISVLLQQYTNKEVEAAFIKGSTFLCKKYTSLRKIRGDGNCYYRAFLYSLCEHLVRDNNSDGDNNAEFYRLKEIVVKGSLKWVCNYGYEEHTIEMFYDELVELFNFIEGVCIINNKKKPSSSKDEVDNIMNELHAKLNEENATSDYCTWFMRVITAAQLKSKPDDYLPYIMAENYGDIQSFCSREVEPMGKECGMCQVAALAQCLGVKVVIEYMDGRMADEDDKLVNHIFGQGDNGGSDDDDDERTTITLLYRPGHYDILYE